MLEGILGRLPHQYGEGLRWFFSDAPGILGIPAMDPEKGGRTTTTMNAEDTRVAEAAERYRRIDEELDAIGRKHQRILQRYYQDAVWRGLGSFGKLAGVVQVTAAAKAAYAADRTGEPESHVHFVAWLAALSARTAPGMKASPDDKQLKIRIEAEADKLVADACRAYLAKALVLSATRRVTAAAMRHLQNMAAKVGFKRTSDED